MVGFIFGGDTQETPESLKRKRSVADALAGRASRAPKNVGEGLTAIGDALLYRSLMGKVEGADIAGRKSADADRSALLNLFGGTPAGDSASADIPMTGAASEVSALDPGDMTGNSVYNDFMGEVGKTVKNPYALAAIAATGKAESGFSPGNVNRTWSDPSESGQPGTAGGIMSWRGPRYQALAATGDLSPTGQAKFFVGEDPNLIASLNNAKSVDEAQSLMNKAWAFRGYDRPGGEAGRRLGYAKGYLPSFQGQGTRVASLDPAAGMPQPDASAAIEATAPDSRYVDPVVNAGGRKASPAVVAALGPTNAIGPRQPSPVAAALTAAPIPTPRPALPSETETVTAASQPPRNTQVAQALTGNPGQVQAAYKLLSNPYATDADRAIASSIIENAQKQADPKYRVDLQKSEIELDNLRNPKISPADQQRIDLDKSKFDFEKNKPTEVGGRLIAPDGKVIYEAPGKWNKLDDGSLFNEATGEFRTAPKPEGQNGFRFKGTSVEAQSLNGLIDSGALTEDQAQQLGAGKTVSGPNGEIIFMTPQGVFAGDPKAGTAKPMQIPQQAQPDTVDLFGDGGAPAPVQTPAPVAPAPAAQPQPDAAPQRQGMIPLTEPKVTIDESKAAGFADRMTQAEDILNKFGAAGGNVKDQFVSDNEYIPDFAENWLMSNDFQNFAQARRNFINAQLRRESGAVIGPDEFANARKQYFPEPNDNAEVLKQKAQNRKTAIDAMIRDAGPTYGKKKPSKDIGDMPDFSKMSDEELQRYIDGK